MAALYAGLFFLVSFVSMHVFWVAIQKLKANKVGPSAAEYLQQQQQQLQQHRRHQEKRKVELRQEVGDCSCHRHVRSPPEVVVNLSLDLLEHQPRHLPQRKPLPPPPLTLPTPPSPVPATIDDRSPQQLSSNISKAFNKSFRLSLVDLASQLLLVGPAVAPVACAVGCRPDWCYRVVVPASIRAVSVLAFAIFRSVRPVMLMKSDKLIWRKIGDIVREEEDDEDEAHVSRDCF